MTCNFIQNFDIRNWFLTFMTSRKQRARKGRKEEEKEERDDVPNIGTPSLDRAHLYRHAHTAFCAVNYHHCTD